MARLYVANCTKQFHDFTYVIPGADRYKIQHQPIDPGFQTLIYMESPQPVLDAIIAQHRQYGLVDVADLPNVKAFVGLCFSIDKPVQRDDISYALDHNLGVLFDRGQQYREEAAVAVDLAYEREMEEARRDGAPIPQTKGMDVEYLEDSDNPAFGSAVRIDHGIERADGRTFQTTSRRGRGSAA